MNELRNFTDIKSYKPYFDFNDIKPEDLKGDNYVDPYYYLRRPIEPERLKLIYQQAFIYDLLYKFAKEYLPDVNDAQKQKQSESETNKATDTTIDSIKEKVLEYLFKSKIEVKEQSIVKDEESENKETVNIWSTDDLNILRKNFSRMKEENYSLKSRLQVQTQESINLREKYENLKVETQTLPDELKTLEKENQRMYIRLQDIESRYLNYNRELESLEETIKEHKEKEEKLKLENQSLKSEILRMEFEINKLENKSKLVKNELKLLYEEKCERHKLKYIKEIEKLKDKIYELENKNNVEKAQLARSQRALEHLRIHFMNSVPIGQSDEDKINENNIRIL